MRYYRGVNHLSVSTHLNDPFETKGVFSRVSTLDAFESMIPVTTADKFVVIEPVTLHRRRHRRARRHPPHSQISLAAE
jgi:hypothetical protein